MRSDFFDRRNAAIRGRVGLPELQAGLLSESKGRDRAARRNGGCRVLDTVSCEVCGRRHRGRAGLCAPIWRGLLFAGSRDGLDRIFCRLAHLLLFATWLLDLAPWKIRGDRRQDGVRITRGDPNRPQDQLRGGLWALLRRDPQRAPALCRIHPGWVRRGKTFAPRSYL